MYKFRNLRADEIDCRVARTKKHDKGEWIFLLLYKDARCDMNILDETVGAFNWRREHTRENANCIVSIYDADKKEWVSKEDTGTESNTEAEKGIASDSFKRACVNWGIGRELYSAPLICFEGAQFLTNGKCYKKFVVSKIEYDSKSNITALEIREKESDAKVFLYPRKAAQRKPDTEQPKAESKPKAEPKSNTEQRKQEADAYVAAEGKKITKAQLIDIGNKMAEYGIDAGYVKQKFKVENLSELTEQEYITITKNLDIIKTNSEKWRAKNAGQTA